MQIRGYSLFVIRDTGCPSAASRCPGVPASCTTAFRCDCIGRRASAPCLRAVPTVVRGRCPCLAVVQDAGTIGRQDARRPDGVDAGPPRRRRDGPHRVQKSSRIPPLFNIHYSIPSPCPLPPCPRKKYFKIPCHRPASCAYTLLDTARGAETNGHDDPRK